LFYERAAEGGDGQAALQLGETYDPAFLKRAGIAGIRGDSAMAKRWYQQAFELGAGEAQTLLNGTTDR
jgi:TPR repeat protein